MGFFPGLRVEAVLHPGASTSTVRMVTPRAPTLVGRDREIAALEAELNRTLSGEFRIVLLLGEPGVGKTRLAGEILARHRATVLGLSARAHPLGGTTSFGLWAEALEGHLRALDPAQVSNLCGGFVDDLGALLRSAAAARGTAPPGEPPRARLLEGLALLVDRLARTSPIVLLLDDVHVADASSWDALHYLARNLATAPVLVLATARPVELAAQPDAYHIVLGLEQDGALTRLGLHPLSVEALGELVAGVLEKRPPPTLVGWLETRSRGNPLFTLGLLRALLDEQADLSAPQLRRLPEGLAERVTARLGGLNEPSRSVLEVLAVVGRRVELSAVAALSGRAPDRVGLILDDLVRARLVAEEERGGEVTYEITHPVIQEAIYQELGTARRRALHRLVGRVLLAAGRLGEAAPHFARSADVGDPEAVEALCGAVRQAEERNLYREALTLLATLVGIVPPGDPRWLAVVDGMVLQAEWVVDHRADVHAALAIPALRQIDAVLERLPDPARRATVKFRLMSFLGWGTGEFSEAERVCRKALELYEEAGDRRGTWLATLELGYLKGMGGDMGGWLFAGTQVAQEAEASGDRFVIMQAVGRGIGWGALLTGRFDTAEHALRRSVVLARDGGGTYNHAIMLYSLGLSLALEGRMAEGHPLLAEAKAVDPNWRDSNQLEFEIAIHWLAGALDTAVAQAWESVTLNASGMARRRALGFVFAVLAGVEMDRSAEASRFLAIALDAYDGRPWAAYRDVCLHAQAVLQWREGQRGSALAGLRRTATRILTIGFLPFAAFALLDLAELAALSRDAEVAATAAVELGEVARRLDRDLYRGLAALGSAWAGLASDAAAPSAAAAQQALRFLDGLGYPIFFGRALDVLGQALGSADRSQAREALEAAASTFSSCGAVRRRDRSLHTIRRLGGVRKSAEAPAPPPGALSRRELDVARLAAEGRTAPEIARELFVSERTVESHLARIYAKLGVASKLELVHRASELGILDFPEQHSG